MTNIQKKFAAAVTASALMFQAALPVFATEGTSLVITGNGASSDNDVVLSQTTTTTVSQNNVANISNDVDASSNTGGNDANMNTGGDVLIGTGNASTSVGIANSVNSNVADVDGCCAVDADVEISGNGAYSDNDAVLSLTNDTQVFQNNYAKLKNDVDADSNTGKNEGNLNTGGDVAILTGDADTSVLISNSANSNLATIGDGAGGGGSVSLKILGNGAYSDNDLVLALNRSLTLRQDNLADIRNDVDANSNTGKNDANKNTGGDVLIGTGDATTTVGIDNLANFNSADLNCGCLLDVLAKISGNGYESDNTIVASLVDTKAAFQNNAYVCGGHGYPQGDTAYSLWFPWFDGGYKKDCNDVDADSNTGYNDADKNTGSVDGGDPAIGTGHATTEVLVENTANANVLTEGGEGHDFPELPDLGDWEVDFGFNWAFLWAWLGGMGN